MDNQLSITSDPIGQQQPAQQPQEPRAAAPSPVPQVPAPQQSAEAEAFTLAQREAKAWASASMIPQRYQGKLGDCIVALDTAKRMGASPLMVMQHLYVVHGTPSWSSTFLIAAVNSSGRYSSLRYESRGTEGAKDYALRAVATEKSTGEVLPGTWITAAMVEAEGWEKKSGSKWKTMPEQMYRYRAASFWARAYAPELTMGLRTVDEMEDIAEPRHAQPVTMRFSPRQMAEAKAEIASGNATVDEIAERYPTLVSDQLDELRNTTAQ